MKLFQHSQTDHPVVHQHRVAFVNVVDEILIIDVNRFLLLALRTFDGELKSVTRFQFQWNGEFAGANRRALGVEHNRAGNAHSL